MQVCFGIIKTVLPNKRFKIFHVIDGLSVRFAKK